ncbi:leucine-rich repeat-containing protein 15-like [Chironomus tepperi]|uniref:leucine-rich repeat-containing protein 15-like n=1 Tax=Chironomus tepperi TaxID=113505 RepID=UPI00391FA2D2
MDIKIAILLLIAVSSVSSQEYIFCLYGIINNTYTCNFNINNPAGRLDFPTIDGSHVAGYTDSDVKGITTGYIASTAFLPPIICNKFQNLETITLKSIGLTTILNGALDGCPLVSSIDLSSNGIKHFDEGVFVNNSKLNWLNLERNNITDLPAGLFMSLENLTELRLYMNQISNLKIEWFRGLTSLEFVYLGMNQIQDIPGNTFNNSRQLRQIWIDNNNLEVIHSNSFGTLPALTAMNFMYNQIDAIDERILNKTGINLLILTNNVCKDGFFSDDTPGRPGMRTFFRECFDNYEEQFPACIPDNLMERVCKLEEENIELSARVSALEQEKEELEVKFEGQIKSLLSAIEGLQSQIDELKSGTTVAVTPTD